MKQKLLFDGELSDPGLDEVLPKLINKAIETEQEVFVRWNGVIIAVQPTSTVDELMATYEELLCANNRKEDAPRDGREKNLYRVFNGIGTFYIVSRSFNEAAEILRKRLDVADYGFTSKREATSVELMATESFMNGKPFFCGDNDRLIVGE